MEITGLILTLLAALIYFSIVIANNREIEDKTTRLNENTSSFFALATSFSFYTIILLNLINKIITNNTLSLIIVSYLAGLLFLLLTFIPLAFIVNKGPKMTLKILKPFNMLAKILFAPIVFVFVLLRELVDKSAAESMTEDDFLELIDHAEEQEGITSNESKLIKSVLEFHDLKVTDIFTPRVDVIAVDKNTDPNDILDIFIKSGYSRLPLYDEDIDDIIGIINYKDLYAKVIYKNQPLESIIQSPVDITEYMEITDLLSLLKLNKAHMAIVKDEFGGTLGIVTMEDILEELVGDIWDEHDIVIENIKPLKDNRFLVLGSTYLDDLTEELGLEDIDDEDYLTVNGWVLANLGKMGVKGDTFTYQNLEVVVTKANSRQILEVEIKILDKIN
jgi:putative hemolysin